MGFSITRVQAEGFLSYLEPVDIDLSQLTYASVVGANGVGKSSLHQAIGWCLMGETRFNDSDSVVHDLAKRAKVAVEGTDSQGVPWRFERVRRFNTEGTFRAFHAKDGEWVQVDDKTNAANQAAAASVVGMSKDVFYSIMVMEGSMGTRFITSNPTDRRQIILGMIPELGRYVTLEAEVKRALTEAKEALVETNARRTALVERSLLVGGEDGKSGGIGERTAELSRLPSRKELTQERGSALKAIAKLENILESQDSGVKNLRGNLSQAEGLLARTRTAGAASVKRASDELSRAVQAQEKLTAAQASLRQQESELAQLDARLDAAHDEVDVAASAVSELRASINRLELTLDRKSAEIEGLDNASAELKTSLSELNQRGDEGHCWVCHSELPPEKVEHLNNHLQDQLDELRSSRNNAQAELELLNSRLGDYQNKMKDLCGKELQAKSLIKELDRQASALDAEIARLETKVDNLTEVLSTAPAGNIVEQEEQRVQAEIRELEEVCLEHRQALERALSTVDEDAASKLTDLRSDLEDIEAELHDHDIASDRLAVLTRDFEILGNQIEEATATAERIATKVEHLTKLLAALGPKGVPSMLLGSVLGAIEDRMNHTLSMLPGGDRMMVQFVQEKTLKSKGGRTTETLDIMVHNATTGKTRPIESFSAGERVRLSLACMFAMLAVLNERTPGGLVSTVFLDEPLGVIDQDAVPGFIEVLHAVIGMSVVKSVVVITHDQRVIDALPQRIEVSKVGSPETTQLRVVS